MSISQEHSAQLRELFDAARDKPFSLSLASATELIAKAHLLPTPYTPPRAFPINLKNLFIMTSLTLAVIALLILPPNTPSLSEDTTIEKQQLSTEFVQAMLDEPSKEEEHSRIVLVPPCDTCVVDHSTSTGKTVPFESKCDSCPVPPKRMTTRGSDRSIYIAKPQKNIAKNGSELSGTSSERCFTIDDTWREKDFDKLVEAAQVMGIEASCSSLKHKQGKLHSFTLELSYGNSSYSGKFSRLNFENGSMKSCNINIHSAGEEDLDFSELTHSTESQNAKVSWCSTENTRCISLRIKSLTEDKNCGCDSSSAFTVRIGKPVN